MGIDIWTCNTKTGSIGHQEPIPINPIYVDAIKVF
jgi:hypothetical protein